jgi:hypothetical protein
MIKKLLALILFAAGTCFAQQPQTQVDPSFAVNAKYTNGVAPGYYPTPNAIPATLVLGIGPGTAYCGNAIISYAGGTLTLTASSTNYVYLNTASSCAPTFNTTGFVATSLPIAIVTTSGSAITNVTDDRTFFFTAPVSESLRACDVAVGDESAAALVNAQLGPQSRLCYITSTSTLVEVDVAADGGTPEIIVARNHQGTISNAVSSALQTAAGGGIACSNTGGTTGNDGVTTCSATLQNTSLAAGDYLELVSGTAGGTAKLMTIHFVYRIN